MLGRVKEQINEIANLINSIKQKIRCLNYLTILSMLGKGFFKGPRDCDEQRRDREELAAQHARTKQEKHGKQLIYACTHQENSQADSHTHTLTHTLKQQHK